MHISYIIITFAHVNNKRKVNMTNVETENGYLVIERIGGLDVYIDDCLVCELSGKSLSDYKSTDDLDSAIEDEIDTLRVMDRITDPYNFI